MRAIYLAIVVTASMAIGVAACGSGVGPQGTTVGGPCLSRADCGPNSLCLGGGDFPGGTCVLPCRVDGDCPFGTACIDKEGGVCVLSCTDGRECRVGYKCKGKRHYGTVNEVLVCIE